VIDLSGSSDVHFESCSFVGKAQSPNNWGGIGSRGDATFVDCKAKWFELAGYKKIVLDRCEAQDIGIWTDSPANSGASYESAAVTIQTSKFRGVLDMAARDLQSLTIRDTVLEHLNLNNAAIKSDVLIERVKGGFINAGVTAKSFSIRNSEVFGNGKNISFVMPMDSAQQVLLESTNFGTGPMQRVNLGPGRPLQDSEWQAAPINSLAVVRNCTLPIVDASWLETQRLVFEGNTIGSLDISNGRIGQLEVNGNSVDRSVNLAKTQVKESKIQVFAKDQAKFDGSNLKAC